MYPILTLTLSDRQFLQGDGNAKATTVSGELRIAQGTGRRPVVVLVHGSGGVGANVDMWSKDFNRMGISTFVLDGFTGRGLTTVSANQALLGRLNLILDAYRVLDVLAKHPRVDSSRIVLMGFSRGGQATLYASLKRFHQMWNRSGVEFAAYVPFYPDCMTTFASDTEIADRPVRIFQGTADDYNPVAPCKAYVERLRAAGHDVELTEYPNASHSFDNPLGSTTPALAKNSQTVRHCVIREEPVGQLVNAQTHLPFTYDDPCVERGPHLGHDPAATQAARKAVADFLRTTLRLE
ncbi:MAG TPA: dienelactone hydrolase family protein [Xanthobacteraceae bacterium]|nr:dienelactone hydrolase family protein [Xanthobacteraceae bacterium]